MTREYGNKMRSRKIALTGVLAGLALAVFTIEAQLPPIWIPGVKLGLSNVVTLIAMLMISRRSAGAVQLIRIVLGAVFCGTAASFMFSLFGGAAAFAVMALTVNIMDRRQIWAVSVLGAAAHSLGQLAAAYILIENTAVISLLPALLICSVITGALTGIVAQRLWFSPLRDRFVQK